MRIFGGVLAVLFSALTVAGPVRVENLRMWPAPDHTRVVFDIDGPVEHTLFMLTNPDRVVIDLRDTRFDKRLPRPSKADRLLSRVRAGARAGGALRVVLDLKQAVRPKSFLLRPNKKYGHRLVVDLYARDSPGAGADVKAKATRALPGAPARLRDVIIAIDPGHGGEDPGALAPGGSREKHIVLAIARRLQAQIRRERGMRAVLVRDGDYYVGLRKRMEVARQRRADLFVSIHADSFRDARVKGSAVYILSRNGASSEAARWLAAQENAADLVGGVTLDDKDELLASVLLDLSQTATLSASSNVGAKVLKELATIGKTHKRHVERAGFMVLKSPDIPSIMVETGFLTNPDEERRLKDPKHQRVIAKAIVRGIRTYFARNAPPGTLLAARNHVIARGETLSGIATRYRVPVSRLRAANELDGSRIKEGGLLRIPL